MAVFFSYTFKYIPWEKIRKIRNIDKFGIRSSTAMNMHKANIIVALSEDTQTMALIYKGEAIAVGSRKSIKETLKSIFTFARKEKEIVAHLDELFEKVVYLKLNSEIVLKDSAYFVRYKLTNELVGLVQVKNDFLEFAIYRVGLSTKFKGQEVFNSLIEIFEN